MFSKYNLGVFLPRTQGVMYFIWIKNKPDFLTPELYMQDTTSTSRSESLWEPSKTHVYEVYLNFYFHRT